LRSFLIGGEGLAGKALLAVSDALSTIGAALVRQSSSDDERER
jgi:hypothetical protein